MSKAPLLRVGYHTMRQYGRTYYQAIAYTTLRGIRTDLSQSHWRDTHDEATDEIIAKIKGEYRKSDLPEPQCVAHVGRKAEAYLRTYRF